MKRLLKVFYFIFAPIGAIVLIWSGIEYNKEGDGGKALLCCLLASYWVLKTTNNVLGLVFKKKGEQ